MVHTLVISVLGMQIKVNLWGSLDRQANPLQEFLALERPSIQKSWMVPEKIPKVFFCPPYGGHMPTHLHSGKRGEYIRITWQKCGSKSSCITHAENKQWTSLSQRRQIQRTIRTIQHKNYSETAYLQDVGSHQKEMENKGKQICKQIMQVLVMISILYITNFQQFRILSCNSIRHWKHEASVCKGSGLS